MAIKSSDQITITDITDGYTVDMSMPSITVSGGKSGTSSSQTVNLVISAMRGTTEITPAVTPSQCTSTSNLVTVGNTSTSGNKLTLPITLGAGLSTSGTVTIPVVVDSKYTITKTFSFSVALTGQDGTSRYTHIKYAKDENGTDMTSVPSDDYPYIGIAVTTNSAAPSSASSYAPWTKYLGDPGLPGANGADGADAIYIRIIPTSGSTTFKNSTGSVTLTAYVFVGGVEATVANNGTVTLNDSTLGSIKWYKDNASTAAATSKSLTITAAQVTGTLSVVAKLEA